MPGQSDAVHRLGRTGRFWRAAVLLLGVALALNGSLRGDDDLWPFAPMSQFAFRVGNVDVVRSTHIDALTTAGTVVKVPLNTGGVGISRAEIEGNLERIRADPSRMRDVAQGQARLHPDQPQYVRLWLRQLIIELDHGREGARHDTTLAVYDVVGTP